MKILVIVLFLISTARAITICGSGGSSTCQATDCTSSGGIAKINSDCTSSCIGSTPGMTFIGTQTASSSATLDFTGLGAYHSVLLVCQSLIPATNSQHMLLRIGESTGPTWEAANYDWSTNGFSSGGAAGLGATADSAIRVSFNTVSNATAGKGFSFSAEIFNLSSSTDLKWVHSHASFRSSTNSLEGADTVGLYTGDTNTITGIRVLSASGNITSGECSLYAMNHS